MSRDHVKMLRQGFLKNNLRLPDILFIRFL
jgi:hypothetical protein